MSNLDSMLERNKDFAAQQSAAGTLMPSLPEATPNLKAMIIGCADMRVDNATKTLPLSSLLRARLCPRFPRRRRISRQ